MITFTRLVHADNRFKYTAKKKIFVNVGRHLGRNLLVTHKGSCFMLHGVTLCARNNDCIFRLHLLSVVPDK
jgi:hypothetical protein